MCKVLLALQGHDAPVSLINAYEEVLLLHRMLMLGCVLSQSRNAVVSPDLATHIQRLGQQHGSARHIAGVGAERIYYTLPCSIDHLRHTREHAIEGRGSLREEGSCHLLQKGGICEKAHEVWVLGHDSLKLGILQQRLKLGRAGQVGQLLLESGHTLLHTLSYGSGERRSHIRDCLLLFFVQEGHLFRRALVSAYGRNLWQVIGAYTLVLPISSLLLQCAHLQFFIIAKSQSPTAVEREHLGRNYSGTQ